MTTLHISPPPTTSSSRPNLHSISEIMPAVLATYGLSMPDKASGEETIAVSDVLAEVMLNAHEEALAC